MQKMTAPNGVVFMAADADVERFLKHGYARVKPPARKRTTRKASTKK